ncbi:unnamed protein product [Hydatigera taeniaeformis]|uniref:Uncharacterized protein n=1 Tax=Hydatigena taeniaeformis TaxID=6205 RepID=A0A0R3X7J4_HYDTA|nr:unnamed protein product [Hydatigera taeniaeformis]
MHSVLSRKHSVFRRWPESQLGPINTVDSCCPLPGHVGLLRLPKENTIPIVPETINLPPASTSHYVSIMVQAESYLEFCQLQVQSLAPGINTSAIECTVCACPQLIRPVLIALYPGKSFSGSRMTTIIFWRQTKMQTFESIVHVNEIVSTYFVDMWLSL